MPVPPCTSGSNQSNLAHYYAVDPTGVRRLPGDFENGLVYAGHCHSGDDGPNLNTLREAFDAKGARSYFGYTGAVPYDVARYYGEQLFTNLIENVQSTSDAYDTSLQAIPTTRFKRSGNDFAIYPCLVGAEVTFGTPGGWVRDQTPTAVSNLDPAGSTFVGASDCPGETGLPRFSRGIPADADIYPTKMSEGAPRVDDDFFPIDVHQCSNLIATKNLGRFDEEVWINVANRPEDEDTEWFREYQLRYKRTINPENGPQTTCELGQIETLDDSYEVLSRPNCVARLRFGPPNPGSP